MPGIRFTPKTRRTVAIELVEGETATYAGIAGPGNGQAMEGRP
jgi:hypothetical protein